MELNKKEMYYSPEAQVFEVKIEGVICGSVDIERDDDYGNYIDF